MALNYQLRPAKHIERHIFVDVLQHLRNAGHDISRYHYVGFGSHHYVDFILFHRLLSIRTMTCVEKEESKAKRMSFNKPYKFIKLEIEDVMDFMPKINNRDKYIVWLDFECHLNAEVMSHIASLVNTLANGSVFMITVNANPPSRDNSTPQSPEEIEREREKYSKELSPYCGTVRNEDVTRKELPNLLVRSMSAKIADALIGRTNDDFLQLFNYVYQDGQRMLTYGGIVDQKDRTQTIKDSLKRVEHVNYDSEPRAINVPALTMREKLFLDKKVPKSGTIHNIPFELTSDEIKNYVEYARYYPTYHEIQAS
ncbi:MAG: hypothetical protein P4L81_08450 [Candidatus Pacebacteria bacterium]|nr:hypothetical protein [Candidatus Paceibacterota bacterium]